MSSASNQARAGAESWDERWQHRIGVIASALLHLLFVLLMLLFPPVNWTPPQGTAGGSRMAVEFIGAPPPQPVPVPPTKKPERKPVVKAHAKSRVQTTLVMQSRDPVPDDVPDEDTANPQAEVAAAAAPPAPATPRRAHTWGQPPGMLPETTADADSGMNSGASLDTGRSNRGTGGPSMEVGGYQVYYDLRSEPRLRAWKEQGMTEIFLPLPGTRRLMACPLETAIKRESGPCRLLEPDSPELKKIGDAREGIDMQQVYKQGEIVWSGPGPYR